RLEAKEEEEDAEERRSRRKRGLRGPLAKARRRPATLGLCYQPWPLPPGRATDRKRPAPNNKEDAAVQGGAGLWEAPLRELGEVPPRAGDPAAPEKHHRHAWVERPAARKTAREEEQLSRQVGICRLQQNAPPPPPKNCTHRQRKRSGVRASLVGHT
ncbi:unnamed protein product, partial [Prorocentrum cordatum]